MHVKNQGLILYNGPSSFDSSPVVVLATGFRNRSNNKKTGPMVQVFIIREDMLPTESWKSGEHRSVCNDCKHGSQFGNSCYVNLGQSVNQVWNTYRRGSYADGSLLRREQLLDYFSAEAVRFGAFGDPCAVPYEVWEPIVDRIRSTGGMYTAYTHSWRVCDSRFKDFVVASVDNPTELQTARDAGWRTFRTMLRDEKLEKGEFYCPATPEAMIVAGVMKTCQDCGACNGTAGRPRRGSAAIVVHGTVGKVANYVKLRNTVSELAYA